MEKKKKQKNLEVLFSIFVFLGNILFAVEVSMSYQLRAAH